MAPTLTGPAPFWPGRHIGLSHDSKVAPLVTDTSVVRIAVEGEVDDTSTLERLLADVSGRSVVIDASLVTFAGSQFLTWLFAARRQASAVVIANPSRQVQRLLDVAGLTEEFAVEVS